VCQAGNVRVTIDSNLRSSTYFPTFLEKNVPSIPVPYNGWAVLEIKYDGFLPTYIRNLVQNGKLTQQAVSKYSIGRMYG
jgi:hypothetical protein